ncbi:MAG: DNA gyrase subunit A [Candidatus Portiera sp.]|nr:DNA gyrase subunit A [Portiera sp.]
MTDEVEIKGIVNIDIQDEMKKSYLDYAMSVIVGRSLPDVRDGLKPVHRRILYAMHKLDNDYNKAHKKSARIVGDVIGKYHPHGDSAVYDAIVRMAQDFALRYPLVDGQGNFGSIDGDDAAAMRYTEIRLTKISHSFLEDLGKDTVDFSPNYDGSETMPDFLPASVPNLLVNGTSGIAVGMATEMPPHNVSEVIVGCLALLDDPSISISELMQHIPAPDFPTGAYINHSPDIRNAYETGRGAVFIRSKYEIEEMKDDRFRIVVEEIPYQVNKATLLERIADLVRSQKLEGISDMRDESNKEGIRIVIELKKGAIANVVVNNLFKHTALEYKISINMVAIVDGKPRRLTLKSILSEFLKHRRNVVTRRTRYLLKQARNRGHILEGLALATANLEEVIALIKASPTVADAKKGLMDKEWDAKLIADLLSRADNVDCQPEGLAEGYGLQKEAKTYKLSPQQAQAILELRLQRLTSMERDKLKQQYIEILASIKEFLEILHSPARLKALIREELEQVNEEYGDERRSQIIDVKRNINTLDLIKSEDLLITISAANYIKAQYQEHYRSQKRGGSGISAGGLKEDDHIDRMIIANTHDTILCFSNWGRVHWLNCHELPISSRTAKGRPIVNYLPLNDGEKIVSLLPSNYLLKKDDESSVAAKKFILLATDKGILKRMSMDHFMRVRKNGINIMELHGGELIEALESDGTEDILLVSSAGLAVKTSEKNFRPQGRAARGVRGMRIGEGQRLIAVIKANSYSHLLIVSDAGYAKRTLISEFSAKGRGGKGMLAMKFSTDDKGVAGCCPVNEQDEVMIIKENGQLMRTDVSGISVQGRTARGVILTRLKKGARIEGVVPIYKDASAAETETTSEAVTESATESE